MKNQQNIQHHGAINGVTGSCHQLHIDGNNSLLIDCGLFQGAEQGVASGEGSLDEQLAIAFDISTVQALIVTHCHIDHVGRIPYLLAAGFRGPIYATEATAALLPLVIEDALKVGVTRNKSIIAACLKLLKRQLVPLAYKQWQPLTLVNSKKVAKIKFQQAGHILGSAYVEVDLGDIGDIGELGGLDTSVKLSAGQQSNKRNKSNKITGKHRVVFSGDLGAPYTPLLSAPKSPYRADTLVIESTYGDKNHQQRKDRTKHLQQIIETAVSDNGVVLIPAFSIGRTQELLYELEQIIYQSKGKSGQSAVWDNIDIIHAWGTAESNGIYLDICKEHNIEFIDFGTAKRMSESYGKEFDKVCEIALSKIDEFNQKYNLIVIDEAQDFSKEFLKMCYHILTEPKRLIYAYDELQSLNAKNMLSPENIFGFNKDGEALVKLINLSNKPKQDIILNKCYRNSLEVLTTAHALGFGIYKENLVQMFDNSLLWKEIGYNSSKGSITEGQEVELFRDDESSPSFLSSHSPIDDIIQFHNFENNNEQVDYIVEEIRKNIQEDELLPSDIIVINPNPIMTKKVVGIFRQKLFDIGINSNLAGVSTSPDVFFNKDSVTFTGIYRAKGNEAAMVYIINSEYCHNGWELAKKRNILFTAITRSRAWVRVCGIGEPMNALIEEFKNIKDNKFKLRFKYPNEEERNHMNIVNRDMSNEERERVVKSKESIEKVLNDLKGGKIKKEDLSKDLIEQIRKMLD